ncbi:feather keratin Cos2-3-like [Patagioenas fasciata]|uniref:feather keratin Cos2-3-like n=1 Tax=Patagioenas fasciata TaxID=372321 RepID=UPI003A997F37
MVYIQDELVRKLLPLPRVPLALRQCRAGIKGRQVPACSLIHFSCLLLLGCQVGLNMSCYDQCLPCQPCSPIPLANSCNEPYVRQSQNSTIVIEPSPVVVTLPGPILSFFPQDTVVGSSTSAAVGRILSCDGMPINSGCCDLSGIFTRYCGRKCLPCKSYWTWPLGRLPRKYRHSAGQRMNP